MAEPALDLFGEIVTQAPDRPIDVTMARYRVDWEGNRPFLHFDVRVKIRGQETPRLAELRMGLTPFALAALLREGQRTLESIGHQGLLLAEGEKANDWVGTTGVTA